MVPLPRVKLDVVTEYRVHDLIKCHESGSEKQTIMKGDTHSIGGTGTATERRTGVERATEACAGTRVGAGKGRGPSTASDAPTTLEGCVTAKGMQWGVGCAVASDTPCREGAALVRARVAMPWQGITRDCGGGQAPAGAGGRTTVVVKASV